jgi:hypothetical protein
MTIDERMAKARNNYEALAGKLARDAEAKAAARRKAIGDTIELWFEGRTEEQRAAFFAEIEAAASARNRKIIATHPMRPEMTAMVAAAAEAAAEAAVVKVAPAGEATAVEKAVPSGEAAKKGEFDRD